MRASVHLKNPLLVLAGLTLAIGGSVSAAAMRGEAAQKVEFDRDVKPILAENCYTCHGFDSKTRLAKLRLDTFEGAISPAASGKKAVVPGKPEESELLKRVVATDARVMPPAATKKTLKPEQVEILRRWIEQGAQYEKHWAFVSPTRPELPAVKNTKWPRNPIDRFVLARLEREGLKPSPEADRRTLIRRLSFDLTGLPPTVHEVEAFVGDPSPDAYEKLVDRLLASPRYGERMAQDWLDLSRYADTHGYHIDSHRDMWPWRDWVLRAYNSNMPYDQFVVEQLAGDLLPNPTLDQKVATGFNRNHPINFEGGAIPEEYQTEYVINRVDTTSTVFMALTTKCAQCHDHKYDPISQKEFYQLYAFFNTIKEEGLDGFRGNAKPFIKVPTPEQTARLAEHDRRIAGLDKQVQERLAAADAALPAWEKGATAVIAGGPEFYQGLLAHYAFDEASGTAPADGMDAHPVVAAHGTPGRSEGQLRSALQLDGQSYLDLGGAFDFERTDKFSYGAWVKPAGNQAMTVVSRMNDAAAFRGWDLYLNDGRAFVHILSSFPGNAIRVNTKGGVEVNKWTHVFVTYDGSSKGAGVKVYLNGKPAELEVTHDTLTESIRTATPTHVGRRNPGAPFTGAIDELRVYGRELTAAEVASLVSGEGALGALAVEPAKRSAEQKTLLRERYLRHADPTYAPLAAELAAERKARTDLDASIPTTMVMEEMEKPRETHLLLRGEYDKKGEKVEPGTPAVLPPLPDGTPNRLTLAKWLVQPDHPLTARVAVNRYWQKYFGGGLVRTPENFGLQAEPPTHPELLDWLATEFVRTGWDVKAMQKLIVTSAAYRQQSAATPELLERDPENRLLARGPRYRFSAEMIRDQALFVAGTLVEKLGGPSVKPYQPKGLWEEIAFGGDFTAQTYQQDKGDALYRRSLYTFWKRTSPPPALQTFDAPEREFCVVARSVTNTPLQALVLMNDPTYVEASRKLAERLMTEVAAMPRDRIRYAFRLALARQPRNEELRVLLDTYEQQLAEFRKNPKEAEKLLSVGESDRNKKLDPAELAAWTSIASVLLNLDETITKN
ncbi:MAG: DUF1553 domain-containing protein [Armatimonadota bacterium]